MKPKRKISPETREKNKIRNKQWRTENREKVIEGRKRYYQNNKEKVSLDSKVYRTENREKIVQRRKQYRIENKEKIASRDHQHYIQNQEKIKNKSKKYRELHLDDIKTKEKQRRLENKEADKEYRKQYFQKNKKQILSQHKEYNERNKEKVSEYFKKRHIEHKEQHSLYNKNYRQNNKSRIRALNSSWLRKRKQEDELFAVTAKLRRSAAATFERIGVNKPAKTEELLGCSWQEAKSHIESHWQLTIVGDGNLRPEYEALARELKIEKQVEFTGKLGGSDLVRQFQNADLFVLPSINSNEAFGIVLTEALACGVPVIASDLPGVRRVFTDHQEGLLITPGSVQDLKKKIEFILNNEELRRTMAVSARRLAEEKYDLSVMGHRLEELFT